MSVTIWWFRWQGDGWKRLSSRWFDRFYDGQEAAVGDTDALLTGSITVELEDRAPTRITSPRFDRWPLLADGTMDRDYMRQGASLALDDVLGHALRSKEDGSVVHAESRFGHRRHVAETRWEPTKDQLALLVTAVEKAGITPGLARLILDRQ